MSGFKFNKTAATAEAERIINSRNNQVNAARKPYHDAVQKHDEAAKKLEDMVKESASLAMEESNEQVQKERKELLNKISAQKFLVEKLFKAIETARLEKVKAMRKCNFPAWKLQPVEFNGKHGGNYVFISKLS